MRLIVNSGARKVHIGALLDEIPAELSSPFAALLPAFEERERELAKMRTADLLAKGCSEICCLGPESETLHDAIDSLIEQGDSPSVVTTWHTDIADACEHLIYAAGGGGISLLALVASHPEVVALLEQVALGS